MKFSWIADLGVRASSKAVLASELVNIIKVSTIKIFLHSRAS